ncbi:hypothetical protein SAMD00023353_5900020 [Rosellinia necatrix]|uniref:Uncharacterized protein n=1 Tax=Rosellinia necatrix TaxID=77044 RepID=A0A1W2TVI2_ROSNE|nr:hypothetical protein SAMD00023353_5900020 [Rosellinia necatrix]
MADEIPTVQILDKQNYFEQTLLPLPNALPYPPLAPSSLRLRTSVLSLTVNNFTYAALGTLLHWWDVHPLPPSTPAPYDDGAKYGRISAWGYAEVLESTVPSVPRGSHLWGYVPLGTLAEDLEVRPHRPDGDAADSDGDATAAQVLVTSAHRQRAMPIYNRYFVYPPSGGRAAEIARRTRAVAHDALLRVMHATAFLMADFAFNADAARLVNPGLGPDTNDDAIWSARDADLSGATVLVLAPGSKVAAIFASLLRARPTGRPRRIIGASSEASRAFVEGTGAYDAVISTAGDPLQAVRDHHEDGSRLAIFDFGGRAGIGPRWAASLAAHPQYTARLLFVGVGSDILDPATASAVRAAAAAAPPKPAYKAVRVNADDMRRRAIQRLGEDGYWAEEARSWALFREEGIKGLDVAWGQGMPDVIKGWDRLARGEVLPNEGLVYKL